jgi:hypothetical protein
MPPTRPAATTGSRGGALRRVERPLRVEHLRPLRGEDVEKAQHGLPMLGEIERRERGERGKICAFGRRSVDEARQCPGECRGLPRELRLVLVRSAPIQHQPGQQQPAAQIGDRRRNRQCLVSGSEVEFVAIEIADRPHPRQQQRRSGVAALGGQPQKRLAQAARRAPGRQQHGHSCEPQRVAFRHRHEAARQRGEERAVGGNRVEARAEIAGHGRPYRSVRCEARRARVASKPSGVPT